MAAIESDIIFDPILGARASRKIVSDSEKLGEKSGQEFGDGFQRSSRSAFSSLNESLRETARTLNRLGGILAVAFGGFVLNRAVAESRNLERSLTGLRSVASGTGADIDEATQAAVRLASDGLIPLSDASAALRSLLANFNGDLQKSVEVFEVFKNSAAFNRQETLSLGEAVRSASEGLKQDLSIKIDNAGITKNLSQLQKEYAASIGTTVGRLTDAQKAQAEYVGILKEGAIFQGDFNRLLNTFDGAIGAASSSVRFLLADIGSIITRSPAVIALINTISNSILGIRKSLQQSAGQDILQPIISNIITFGRSINDFLVTPFVAIGRIGQLVFQSLVTGLNTIVAGFGRLGLVIADVLSLVGVRGKVQESLKNFAESSASVLEESAGSLQKKLTGIFDPISFQERTGEFLNVLQNAVDNASPILQDFSNKAKTTADDVVKSFGDGAKRINTAINASLARGLSASIQQLAGSLARGEGLFSNFGNFVLGTLGDLAIQVGQVAIAFGITTSAIQSLSPGTAIAAGAALVAIGSVLKAKFGGEGSGVGDLSSGSGGFAPAVGFGAEPIAEQGELAEERATVEVNIAGDVLDSDETGSRIVQLIQNSLDNEDVRVIGGAV